MEGIRTPEAFHPKPILFTVERLLVLRKLGRLEEADRKSLRQSLATILEISAG
jgi:hypothetical protein